MHPRASCRQRLHDRVSCLFQDIYIGACMVADVSQALKCPKPIRRKHLACSDGAGTEGADVNHTLCSRPSHIPYG